MRIKIFCRPSVLCDRASVCHVDDAADCSAVSPLTGVGAVRAGRGLNVVESCKQSYRCHKQTDESLALAVAEILHGV